MRARGLFSVQLVLAVVMVPLMLGGGASGATEKVLNSFGGAYRHGWVPASNLTADANGNLYGTTSYGGDYDLGTVYKLTAHSSGGWTQTVLHNFKGGSDGSSPYSSGVVLDAQGNVYGTTSSGGNGFCGVNSPTGCGTAFELTPNSHGGWTESIVYNFQGGTDGSNPRAGLVFDSSGSLYGTTVAGGICGVGNTCYGTVFKLTPNSGGGWTESVLYSFTGKNDGSSPSASLVFDAVGNLYGTAPYGGTLGQGVAFQLTPSSKGPWTESVLYSFTGGQDGYYPEAPLIFDAAGNLYGTTDRGGGFYGGAGTVFELKSNGNGSWSESVLYRFGMTNGDGLYPDGVIFDNAGNLYGTTLTGGNTGCYSNTGCGVVFELVPGSGGQWTERILHTFSGGADGGIPYAGVVDVTGTLYGTTGYGGHANLGAVFKLSPRGTHWETSTIYWFPGGDGYDLIAGLVSDRSGNLYGTTNFGGLYENGAVFKLTPNSKGGWTRGLIHNFNGMDGSYPSAPLIFDSAGNLYGTTSGGGTGSCYPFFNGCGVVFKLTPSSSGNWTESVLYNFQGGADGASPDAGLVFNKQGHLFGTTFSGGGNGTGCMYGGCGTVFELTPSSGGQWTENVIYSFTGGNDNGEPYYGSLVVDATGNLYGTTSYLGCDGCIGYYSTAFELSPNAAGTWTQSVIYTFTDSGVPFAGVTLDASGNLYGTTAFDLYHYSNSGTVFELMPSAGGWTKNILYSFTGGSDGGLPVAGVVFDAAGNLYGTTFQGGNTCSDSQYRCGVVYKLAPGSGGQWAYSLLHAFNGSPGDGFAPDAGLIFDAAGNLYGTTTYGGPAGGGVVYEVTP